MAEAFLDNDLVDTGNPFYNGIIKIGTFLGIGICALSVGITFLRSIKHYRRRTRGGRLPRAFWLFLVLALAAFLVTNVLRFEHRRITWAIRTGELDEPSDYEQESVINWLEEDLSEASTMRINDHADRILGGIMPGETTPGQRDPGSLPRNFDREASTMDRLHEKLFRTEKAAARAAERLPWVPRNWHRETNAWDYFRLLINSDEELWWTSQWFMGYASFCIFAGIESFNRDWPESPFVPIAILGCLVSLGGSQCLFFALLVLTPRARGRLWVPKASVTVALVILQASSLIGCVHLWQTFWTDRYETPWDTIVFSSQQGVAYFGIPLILLLIMNWPNEWGLCKSPRRAKATLMRAWNFVSAFSFFTHLLIASVILVGTDPTERHSNFFGTVTHPWIEKRSSMDHIKSNAMQIFGTLGENHWINAVAWDVLFAAVGMACWSAAGNLDARSMVKCALFPWLDELHGNLKLWKYNVPDVVGRGGLRGGATRSGGEYLKNFDLHEDHQSKRSSSRSSARAQSVDPEPALGTKRKPGRPPKRPSSRAASQQPEEPPQRRSSSRSTRVSTRSPSVGRRSSSRGGRTVSSSIQLDPTDMRRRASSKKSQDRETRRLPDSEKDEQTRLAEAFHCGAGMAEQAGLTLTLFIVGGLGMASAGVFGVDEL